MLKFAYTIGLSWFAAASLLIPATGYARPTGEAQGCGNCHYKTNGPTIEATFAKAKANPGETITLKVALTAADPEAKNTGIYIRGDGSGKFGIMDSNATRLHESIGVLHAEPMRLVDRKAEFTVKWTAPTIKGVSSFTILSITGNSNGTSDDDHNSSKSVQLPVGCDAKTYFADGDRDGHGDKLSGTLSCEPIEGFVEKGGDCKDDNDKIHPDATEICNAIDDNCDGESDENLDPGLYYQDGDGDGFAPRAARAIFTCRTEPNVVKERGDCAPDDADIHPNAEEVKNGKDDNCNGEVDEAGGGEGKSAKSGRDDESDESSGGAAMGGCTYSQQGALSWLTLVLAATSAAQLLARRRRRGDPRRTPSCQ